MNGLHVIKPGPLTTLQDGGRWGYAKWGLTTGGPMDGLSFINANRLLGNLDNATSLEITFGGISLLAYSNTQIALCGNAMSLMVNQQPQPAAQAVPIQSGDQIDVISSGHRKTCRAYLAIRGGFTIPPTFGSTATVIREGIGGIAGRPLQANDWLTYKPRWPRSAKTTMADATETDSPVRVVCGYQYEDFSIADQETFFDSEYTISAQSDRMGYRLTGPSLTTTHATMLSEGIVPGAIQIPPDGQPIILLADRQTIGGYPKIGSVIQADRWRLGQLQPGHVIRFAPISADQARQQLVKQNVDYL